MTKRTLICLVLGSLIVIPSACGTDSEEESSTEPSATGIDAKTTGTGVGPKVETEA
ncbi:MAG: hypothetical protein H0T15_02635 [Thermoleophilaceae bacterium]|nr:hypothetical protein [Thermoleophilaceae bacterium]